MGFKNLKTSFFKASFHCHHHYQSHVTTLKLCLSSFVECGCTGRQPNSLGSGTHYQTNLEILTVSILLNGSWKQFSFAATSVTRALEVFVTRRQYINLCFTYLLTYLRQFATKLSLNVPQYPRQVMLNGVQWQTADNIIPQTFVADQC